MSTWGGLGFRDGRCGALLTVMHVSWGESVSLSPCPRPLCTSHPVWFSLLNSSLQQWFTKRPARVRGSEPRTADTREQKPSPSIFLLLLQGGDTQKLPREAEGPSPATATSPRHLSLCVHTPSHSFRRETPFPSLWLPEQNRIQSLSRPPRRLSEGQGHRASLPLCSRRYIRCSRRRPEPSAPRRSPPWKPGSAWGLPQLRLEQREEAPGRGNSEP